MGQKEGLDRNPAPFKIQYPMKNQVAETVSTVFQYF
jgi:hypothetical protein